MKKIVCLILCLYMLPIIVIAQEIGKDAVVAASNMNVLYMGIANPIEIAVPGVPNNKVTATVTNGTIKKVPNGWEVTPAGLNESIITILVDNKKVADKKFRVKAIPDPVAVISGKYSGAISKADLLSSDILEVKLPDFALNLKWEIESFTLLVQNEIGESQEFAKGNKVTDRMKTLMTRLSRGQTIIFKDIKASGPDGKIRDLAPLSLKIE